MSEKSIHAANGPRRWPWIVAAVLALLGVLAVVGTVEDTADVVASDTNAPAPVVSFLDVTPGTAATQVAAFGEVLPRWNIALRSTIPGRILDVHDAALAGGRVEEGDLLFSIEPSQYESDVAAAELTLAQAELARRQAEYEVTVARDTFKRTGAQPPNDLALRLPQFRVAERSVSSAQAQLRAARQRLADTKVIAPFSGFVIERLASPGQTVVAGEALIRLADDQRFELVVELNESDWALLEQPIAGSEVRLFHRDGTALGSARIRDGGGFLDPQTRQRRVFLELDNVGPNVLSGDFVRAVFSGRTIENTLSIPESALTQTGHVWALDADDVLLRFEPKVMFRSDGSLTLAAPHTADNFRIVLTPLASFVPGQSVTPRRVGDAVDMLQASETGTEGLLGPVAER